ncbi:ribosomal RNA small subunit methyltransferase A [Myxococcota bacterium]|nr:ribosomal RNA small subunit methyltransferase A [Myxococcota bacterium]
MDSHALPHPSKAWGQNYLQNRGIIHKIIELADLQPGDKVVEIGGGRGALTQLLSQKEECFLTVLEPHGPSFEFLETTFGHLPHVTVLDRDATMVDFSSFSAQVTVGNLPYNVASRILTALLRTGRTQRKWVLMFQREMAQRIVSAPDSKTYGALSVAAQLVSVPKIAFHVSPGSFFPPPKVESSVVEFTPLAQGDLYVSEGAREFLLQLFGMRRKTLWKSLSTMLGPEGARNCIDGSKLDEKTRPENITPEQFKLLISSALQYRRL